MKKRTLLLFSLIFIGVFPVWAVQSGDHAVVDRVIDGDSLVLDGGMQVRLLGIDAPEIHDDHGRNHRNALRFKANPDAVKTTAATAKETLRKWSEGKPVRIETDPENARSNHLDDYGRLLAYVFLEEDDLSLNARMVKEGQAFVYRKFKHARRTDFMRYERDAKRKHKGIWL